MLLSMEIPPAPPGSSRTQSFPAAASGPSCSQWAPAKLQAAGLVLLPVIFNYYWYFQASLRLTQTMRQLDDQQARGEMKTN